MSPQWSGDASRDELSVPPIPRAPTIPMVQVAPYIWLYSIDIPTTPKTKLRITPYPEQVEFEKNSEGVNIVYYPFDIGHAPTNQDVEGKLPSVGLRVQNVTLTMADFLASHNGLIGERVRIVCIQKPRLPDGAPVIDDTFEIQTAEVTDGAVSFQLGQYSLYRTGFPNRRITREYCAHEYGGAGCGYDVTRAGALQSCDKTKSGSNGCTVHGLAEAAAGLTNRHPNRMLVFEGVLRSSGLGVS